MIFKTSIFLILLPLWVTENFEVSSCWIWQNDNLHLYSVTIKKDVFPKYIAPAESVEHSLQKIWLNHALMVVRLKCHFWSEMTFEKPTPHSLVNSGTSRVRGRLSAQSALLTGMMLVKSRVISSTILVNDLAKWSGFCV